MWWPRWLAKVAAHAFGYFWLPCPCCRQQFAGFESGDYSWGVDAMGRTFRHRLEDMLPVLIAEREDVKCVRDDIPRHWWGCCKDCDKWEPVRWYPVDACFAYDNPEDAVPGA